MTIKPPTKPKAGDKIYVYVHDRDSWDEGEIDKVSGDRIEGRYWRWSGPKSGVTYFGTYISMYRTDWKYR